MASRLHTAEPYIAAQRAARRYVARWLRVEHWALSNLPGDLETRDPVGSPRVAIRRGSNVVDLFDDDEAESRAWALESLALPPGLPATVGGRRRVLVRVHTWIEDTQGGGVLYSPQWITTGDGLTLRAAVAAHNRYLRAYTTAVAHGVESRRLKATAMEVAWWTARTTASYV